MPMVQHYRQTDGRFTIAVPCFALYASHAVKTFGQFLVQTNHKNVEFDFFNLSAISTFLEKYDLTNLLPTLVSAIFNIHQCHLCTLKL